MKGTEGRRALKFQQKVFAFVIRVTGVELESTALSSGGARGRYSCCCRCRLLLLLRHFIIIIAAAAAVRIVFVR